MIEECQQLFADRIHLKKLNVTIDISAELAIKTDLKRFEFIIRNIFNNAIKFSLSGKSVVIGQQENPQSIIISIRDEGLGMDAATISSLQDKGFQKSFEGTFHEKGTGIGLLLCHEFAKRINCTISIESTIGFGSTFYIQISKNS
ncbi:Sensor histidine kinase RcsC [compost metagenome]